MESGTSIFRDRKATRLIHRLQTLKYLPSLYSEQVFTDHFQSGKKEKSISQSITGLEIR